MHGERERERGENTCTTFDSSKIFQLKTLSFSPLLLPPPPCLLGEVAIRGRKAGQGTFPLPFASPFHLSSYASKGWGDTCIFHS